MKYHNIAGFLFALAGLQESAVGARVDFDTQPLSGNEPAGLVQSTPLRAMLPGMSVAFSSSDDPGGFEISPSFLSTMTGNILFDPDLINPLTLTIQVDRIVHSVELKFASSDTALFRLQAFREGSLVGERSAVGVVPTDYFFPEGIIGFAGAEFDKVILSSEAGAFAIDDVTLDAAVPEPNGMSLLAIGVVLLAVVRCKRKRLLTL
jgi:hypothetical protein